MPYDWTMVEKALETKGATWVKDNLEGCLIKLKDSRETECKVLLFKSLMPLSVEFQTLFDSHDASDMEADIGPDFRASLDTVVGQIEGHFNEYPRLCSCIIKTMDQLDEKKRSVVLKSLEKALFPLMDALAYQLSENDAIWKRFLKEDQESGNQAQCLDIWRIRVKLCRLWLWNYQNIHTYLDNSSARLDSEFWTCIKEGLLIPFIRDSNNGDILLEKVTIVFNWIWVELWPLDQKLCRLLWPIYWKWTLQTCKGFMYYVEQEKNVIFTQYSHILQEEKRLQLLSKCHHRLILFQQSIRDQLYKIIPGLDHSNTESIHMASLKEIFYVDCQNMIQALIQTMMTSEKL